MNSRVRTGTWTSRRLALIDDRRHRRHNRPRTATRMGGRPAARRTDRACPCAGRVPPAIVYNPDPVPSAQLDNAAARALVAEAFAVWASAGSLVAFSEGTALAATWMRRHPLSQPRPLKHYWRVEGDGLSP